MSSTLQRRRRAKLNEMRQSAEIEQPVEETVPAFVPIEQTEEKENGTESTEETKTTEEVNEESDVFDEFNVSDVLREQQLQQANEEGAQEGADEFQQLLFNLLGGMMNNADSVDGQPSEDYAKFMEDFKKGFSTGYDASTQYGQKSNPSNGEPQQLNPIISFLFTSKSFFSMLMAWTLILLGMNPYPLSLYLLIGLCILRLLYLFFVASPYQTALLTSVPAFLGWLLTMLNIVTASTIGDYLSVLIDSGFFLLKQYTQFRFQMYISCWVISYIPDLRLRERLMLLPINWILLILIPVASLGVVSVLYVRERAKQRKHVLFLVNFLSLFTNPEMQECEIKDIVADNNAIRDEEKMKSIAVDAYALYKGIPKSEAELFVGMYYPKALKEYTRKFVTDMV
ncbi:hypothetical protein WA577_000154, partial [Blastocystis sp. JDR]